MRSASRAAMDCGVVRESRNSRPRRRSSAIRMAIRSGSVVSSEPIWLLIPTNPRKLRSWVRSRLISSAGFELAGERIRSGPFPAARLHGHVHQQLVPGGARRPGLLVELGGIGQECEGQRPAQRLIAAAARRLNPRSSITRAIAGRLSIAEATALRSQAGVRWSAAWGGRTAAGASRGAPTAPLLPSSAETAAAGRCGGFDHGLRTPRPGPPRVPRSSAAVVRDGSASALGAVSAPADDLRFGTGAFSMGPATSLVAAPPSTDGSGTPISGMALATCGNLALDPVVGRNRLAAELSLGRDGDAGRNCREAGPATGWQRYQRRIDPAGCPVVGLRPQQPSPEQQGAEHRPEQTGRVAAQPALQSRTMTSRDDSDDVVRSYVWRFLVQHMPKADRWRGGLRVPFESRLQNRRRSTEPHGKFTPVPQIDRTLFLA